MRKWLVITSAVVALMVGSGVANATTIQGTLLSDHCTGGCGPQDDGFGTVTLTDIVPGTVEVTIDLFNDNLFINSGFDGTVGFNLIGTPTLTVDSITSPFVLLQPGTFTQFDGFKDFDYAIAGLSNGLAGAVAGPLTFRVSATGLDVLDFVKLSSNSNGNGGDAAYFVVDIYSGTTGNTGLVDVSVEPRPTTFDVPDGGSAAALLGSVLVAFGMFRRRFV